RQIVSSCIRFLLLNIKKAFIYRQGFFRFEYILRNLFLFLQKSLIFLQKKMTKSLAISSFLLVLATLSWFSSSLVTADIRQVPLDVPNVGPIIGEDIPVVGSNQKVTRFLGIPYAKPPIGSLRFRKPVPVDQWIEPKETLAW